MTRPSTVVRLLCGLLWCASAPAQTGVLTESRVRAAVVMQLANYIEWPAQAFRTPQDALQFCVLGADRLGTLLSEAAQARTINGRKATVRNIARPEEGRSCHVLFVGYAREKQLSDNLQFFRSRPVLTVGEADAFLVCGGIINLSWDEGSVRFEINQEAAAQAGLRLSSRLLRLARLYGKGG